MHRIFVGEPIPDMGQSLEITGEEAVHAVRVKRIEPGDGLALTDGAGVRAEATVEHIARGGKRDGPTLDVRITARSEVPWPGVAPVVEVLSATPKGSRVDELVDGLSQVGAASWSPLVTARGVVDPRDAKLARLERIAREAAKQCSRPWVLKIGPPKAFAAAVEPDGARVIVADATGGPWAGSMSDGRRLRLLVGPEGGWTGDELALASRAGATIARFGVHTMRIEVAAVAACAVLMSGGVPARGADAIESPTSS